ncbi:splicing factor 45-like [Anneissia japonica]|uniref:splicing factor 45-like n=1 Tax=Anneissia japonica TaxID=1529436 RepID=UPI0014258975|nr:splicing factor 45-like [Anneissia japonica]
MSLYDGLGVDLGPKKEKTHDGKKSDVSGWSAGIRMMQSQLRLKKAALTETQRKIRSATLAPVVDLKGQSIGLVEEGMAVSPPVAPSFTPSKHSQPIFTGDRIDVMGSDIGNEYDPAYPNEYEKVVKKMREKRQKERQLEREKDIEERRKRRERERERDRDRNRDREKRDRSPQGFSRRPADSDEEEDDERDKQKRRSAGACAMIAPPSSLINEDAQPTEEELKAPMLPPPPSSTRPKNFGDIIKKNKSNQEELHPERSTTPPPGSEFEDLDLLPNASKIQNFQPPVGLGAASVAAKIMAKYGFKEGRGLGKSEQGISTALSVEKTSKRGGKIIDASKSEPLPQFPLPNIPRQQTTNMPSLLKNPTKVVLLMNMVGPGEVDEDLEPETAEECSKYGPVTKVVIYEEPDKVEEEAVRIFVEFARMESAIKAVVDLNGRYFGGRVVKASFYSVEKYKGYQLNE